MITRILVRVPSHISIDYEPIDAYLRELPPCQESSANHLIPYNEIPCIANLLSCWKQHYNYQWKSNHRRNIITTFEFLFKVSIDASLLLFTKPICIKKLVNFAYHDLGACRSPYRAYYNLQTLLGWSLASNPGGCRMNTSSLISSFRNAFLTSICDNFHPCEIAKPNTHLTIAGLTTRL